MKTSLKLLEKNRQTVLQIPAKVPRNHEVFVEVCDDFHELPVVNFEHDAPVRSVEAAVEGVVLPRHDWELEENVAPSNAREQVAH